MTNQFVWQMFDIFREAGLTGREGVELSLQFLAWAKLSTGEKLPPYMRMASALSADPSLAIKGLSELGNQPPPIGSCFSGVPRIGDINPRAIRSALELSARLSNTGLLNDFDCADIALGFESGLSHDSSIPGEIADFMISLISKSGDHSVYVPWDFNGQLATRAARLNSTVYLEAPHASTIPSLVGLLSGSSFQVAASDPIRSPSAIEDGRPRLFDFSVSFPPLGLRYEPDVVDRDWFKRFPEKTTAGAVLAVRHVLSQTKRLAVIAVPNSILFSPGSERSLRQDLLERGIVHSVISLPAGALTNTNVQVSVLVLTPPGGNDDVLFVNADSDRFYEPSSKTRGKLTRTSELSKLVLDAKESPDSALVLTSKVLENSAQMQVNRYVLSESTLRLLNSLLTTPMATIGELAVMVRPMITKPKSDDTIGVVEIGAADLPTFGYISAKESTTLVERSSSKKNSHQFLRPYDIVLIIKGSVGKVGIVSPDVPAPGLGGWIAGQSAIVLRVDQRAKVGPRVLAMLLRSSLGRELLNGIVSGATVPLIQLKELTELRIPVPDAQTARQAEEVLDEEARLQDQIEELRQEQAQLARELWPNI